MEQKIKEKMVKNLKNDLNLLKEIGLCILVGILTVLFIFPLLKHWDLKFAENYWTKNRDTIRAFMVIGIYLAVILDIIIMFSTSLLFFALYLLFCFGAGYAYSIYDKAKTETEQGENNHE